MEENFNPHRNRRVPPYGYVFGVILQYGHTILCSHEATALTSRKFYMNMINLLEAQLLKGKTSCLYFFFFSFYYKTSSQYSVLPVVGKKKIMGLLLGGHLPDEGYI